MLAYLMLFSALSNAVCLHNDFFFLLLIFANAFCFMLYLGLLTHSLFISSMIFHHAQCFKSVGFFLILCSHHFSNERAMCSLEKYL